MTDDGLQSLRKPLTVNRLELAHRMVMGPSTTLSPLPDGRPSEESLAWVRRRAKGKPALIILGGTISTTQEWDGVRKSRPRTTLRMDHDDFLPGLAAVAAASHEFGVPIFAQLNTGLGRMGVPGDHFIAASPVNVFMSEEAMSCVMPMPGGMATPTPRAATVEEVERLIAETVASAVRVKTAKFDGVEIGAHMSYFLASFLSPRTNLRTDRFGGSLENRARAVVEVIRGIRAATGPDFPIGVRMAAAEHVEGGQTAEVFAQLAALFEQAGADFIAVTDGGYESMDLSFAGDGPVVRHGEAALFRNAVKIPLMLQGIHKPEVAARAIDQGVGDMVMLVRPMLADPDYPAKVLAGEAARIAPCRNGNTCLKRIMLRMPVSCPVNPDLGREGPATVGQRVKRTLMRPVEAAVLKLTASPAVMKFAARFAPKEG